PTAAANSSSTANGSASNSPTPDPPTHTYPAPAAMASPANSPPDRPPLSDGSQERLASVPARVHGRTESRMGRRLGYMVLCASAVGVLGVAAAQAAPAGTPGSTGSLGQQPCQGSGRTAAITRIVVIPFENHSYSAILGASAPSSYLKTLA